jgi:hypothetical protein
MAVTPHSCLSGKQGVGPQHCDDCRQRNWSWGHASENGLEIPEGAGTTFVSRLLCWRVSQRLAIVCQFENLGRETGNAARPIP